MKKFAIAALCTVATLAFAQEGTTSETTSMGNSPIKVFANVDLNLTKITASGAGTKDADLGTNLAVGVDGVYNIAQAIGGTIGAGLGLDFNMLKGDIPGGEIKANYLDIPVNFAYNIVPTNNLDVQFLVGPYVGIPVAKWKISGAPDQNGNIAIGANVEAHTTWTITNDFALGAHVGFKYAFNDLVDDSGLSSNADVKYWALGLGVSAKFL